MNTFSFGRGPSDNRQAAMLRLGVLALLVAAVAATRVVPHPWNVTPLGAMALFSGAHFADRRVAAGVAFGALALGDLVIGFHMLMPFVYLSFAAYLALGYALRERRSLPRVAGAVGLGAVQFYLVTNFGAWLLLGTYPHTPSGLLACYAAGLPYLGRTLLGDAVFTAVLFGTVALAALRWSALRPLAPQRG